MATVRSRQGAGRLCLDFVRTLRCPGTPAETGELRDASVLTARAGQCGTVRVTASPSVRAEEARSLREAIRRLLHTTLMTDLPCPGDSHEINRTPAHPTPTPTLDAAGRGGCTGTRTTPCARPSRSGPATPSTSPTATRLRRCAGLYAGRSSSTHPGPARGAGARWTRGNRAKKAGLRRRAAE
jgi:predicted RNA-binding Zn ribbon-like protein